MQSESARKCPAKGQRGIEFFQILFKIPPGIANISDHCVILWGRMNPHSFVPPPPHLSLCLSLSHTHARRDTTTQCLPICTEKHTALGYSSIDHSNPNICCFCFYSAVFSKKKKRKMDHFLILPQGLLLCSGVTRTRCKWEAKKKKKKVGRNVNWSDTSANPFPGTCARVCICATANVLTCFFFFLRKDGEDSV